MAFDRIFSPATAAVIVETSGFTLSASDCLLPYIFVNPGADITITLPDAAESYDFEILHIGASFAVTVNLPSASALATLAAGEMARVRTYLDTSNVPQYQTFGAYTLTNVTTDRAYDANATTTDELADVLGTLIGDLKAKGVID